MQCTGIAPVARWAGLLIALVVALVPASPAAAERGRVSASELLIASAGWHGRPIRHPHRHSVRMASTERVPTGWQAGPVGLGTGTHSGSGSKRVREVQRRLRSLGYRPGPVDGIFGARTRAAVAWFQVKHGFPVDGRASLAVVRHLRQRTSPTVANAPTEQSPARQQPPAWETYRQLVTPTPTVAAAGADGPSGWWIAALTLLAFAIGFAGVALLQRNRRQPAPVLAPPEAPRALGYARVESAKRMKAHAASIATRCAENGLALTGLITDDAADQRPGRVRPGLGYALSQLQAGQADCLVVGRIGHLTRSPEELIELLDELSEREAALVVLNADPRGGTRRWARQDRAALETRPSDD